MADEWDAERFTATLAGILKRTGISQAGLAEAAGISRSQANRWIHGHHRPDYDHLRRFTNVLTERYTGLDALPRDLLAAGGYAASGGEEAAGPPPPPLYAFVDLADDFQRYVWEAPPGIATEAEKLAAIGTIRAIRSPQGRPVFEARLESERHRLKESLSAD